MSYVATIAVMACLMGSSPVREGYFQVYKPPIEAKPGYTATGTVLRQDTRTLILNTTPCVAREKQIVIFHSPFGTRTAEPISCPGGGTFQQITANQE